MSLAWSPDGTRIASAGYDGRVGIWDASTATLLEALPTSSLYVLDVRWSSDGSRLASSSTAAVEIFDGATGARRMAIDTSIAAKEPPKWGPGVLLALPTYDGRILVIDTSSGRESAVLEGHTGEVSSLAWSPDGRTLMSGSWDHTVRLWDWPSGAEKTVLEAAGVGNLEVRWSSSGRFASWYASVARDVTFYEVATGERKRIATGPVAATEWKPGEDTIAIGTAGGTVEILSVASDVSQARFTCGRFADTLAWSPDGRFLAALPFNSGNLCLWDATRGTLAELHVASRPLIALAWSPDGSRLALGGYNGKLRVLAAPPTAEISRHSGR